MNDFTIRPPDLAARRRALDPTGSFIVQAPAGSGKTELLIQRILALLARVEAPEEILAITFTRKAAGEMKTRLLDALSAAGDATPPAAEHARVTWDLAREALRQDRERGWNLVEHPGRLQIMTIDSFCAGLTRRMPWLARFGAQPEISDDPREFYRQAAERLLESIETGGEGGNAARRLLRHLDNRLGTLRDLLVDMLGRRDQWLRHLLGRDAEARVVLEGSLEAFLETNLASVYTLMDSEQRAELFELAQFAASQLETGPLVDAWAPLTEFPQPVRAAWPAWEALLDLLLTGQDAVRRSVNRNQGFPPANADPAGMKVRMLGLLEKIADDDGLRPALVRLRSMPRAHYLDRQWRILEALITLLPLAVLTLQQVFREHGKVDFIEIAGAARAALGDVDRPEDLLLQLDSAISHILVDEFQDTSHGQYVLLEMLTGGWQPNDGRTLFVVGDPMQSIYRFREAEVGLYLRARRTGLANVRLEPLTLQANFRSQAGLVEWVNQTFAALFPGLADELRGAVPYTAALAIHPHCPGEAVTLTAFSDKQDEAEANVLADRVEQLLAEHPGDTHAILVRSRQHLRQIVCALKARRLRFQAQEIEPLSDRPVVQDLRALTRALIHPGDRIAWLAILRAPWCGLRLDDLLDICEPSAAASVWELLRQREAQGRLFPPDDPGSRRRIAHFLRVVGQALQLKGRVSLRRMVEAAWLGLNGPACITASDLQDARQVFELLDLIDDGGDVPRLELLDEQLAKLFAAPDNEAPAQLQIMTIHKAKGLEFDTVLIPGLGKTVRGHSRALLRWQEMPDDHLLLAPLPALDGQDVDPTYQSIGNLMRDKDDLETLRLFYVAATRAKQRLHLLGHAKPLSGGGYAPVQGSLLAAAWPVLADAFAARAQLPEPGEAVATAIGQPLLRLPADWQPRALPVSIVRPSDPLARASERPDAPQGKRFTLQTEVGRQVGTVTHHFLEKIAAEGLSAWPPLRIAGLREEVRLRLLVAGVPRSRVDKAASRVVKGLENAVTGRRGRWILAEHPDAANELPISGMVDDQLVHAIIDRTFRDVEGVRWIVDYKTSEPGDEPIASFQRRESEAYRGQLVAYSRLFAALEPDSVVRAGLYFPGLDLWLEMD